jgi:hypothetical protein
MKLFYVDQFNKVHEFNGTDEEKQALYDAGNLYHDEWNAQEATRGKKIRYRSSYIFKHDILDKFTLTPLFTPIQIRYIDHIEEYTIMMFRSMVSIGLIFDTIDEAKAVSEKLKAVLRGEAEHRASTPKQSQVLQDGQHQPCSEEQQSLAQSSCEHTTSSNGCKCHEQSRPCSQGRVQVTVIEMSL